MATVQRYVNTGSTAGGDGTTNATSGATRAYASLSEWEANAGGSATDDYIVDCCGSTADSAGAVTVNFTTDITTGSVLIRGNRGEADGFYDGGEVISTSHYRLAPGNVTGALLVQETKSTVDGIQVSAGHSGSFGIGISIGAAIVTVRKCRVHDANSTDYGIGRAGSAYSLGASTWTIENNLVVGFDTHQINTQYNTSFGATHNIYHNTCYGGTVGIAYWRGSTSCTINIKGNAIAGSSGSDISGTGSGGTVTFNANATDDYDLGTTGEIDLGVTTDAWTSPGTASSSDFTVKDASSPLNTTVSGALVSTDIRDSSRSNYSVGCFEFASGGTTYNEALTESVTASDALGAAVTVAASVSEAASASDSLGAAATIAASVSEVASVSDSLGAAVTIAASVSEVASVSDSLSVSAVIIATILESVTTTDSIAQGNLYNESISESVSASDALSTVVAVAAAVSESISASDSIGALLSAFTAFTETLTPGDSFTVSGGSAVDALSTVTLVSVIVNSCVVLEALAYRCEVSDIRVTNIALSEEIAG